MISKGREFEAFGLEVANRRLRRCASNLPSWPELPRGNLLGKSIPSSILQNINKKKLPAFGATRGGTQMNKYAVETTVGIFLVFGLLCIGYMAVKLGHVSLFGDNAYSLFARFTTVSGLRVGSPVNLVGIEVGGGERLTVASAEKR